MNPILFQWLAGAWVFLFGACVGSFVNVLVWRIPQGIPFYRGRSFCPACRAPIRGGDMVPVLSWFVLRGRCRACGAPISPRYPAVEAAGGALALWCWLALPWQPGRALCAFAAAALLLAVALIDHDTMEIPNGLVLALAVPALAATLLWPQPGLAQRAAGALCVSLPLLVLALFGGVGGGDVKLMAVCGWMLGWQSCLVAAFLALLLGGARAVWLLAVKKAGRKARMPFGPALCAGVFLALLYGRPLLAWYLGLCGL